VRSFGTVLAALGVAILLTDAAAAQVSAPDRSPWPASLTIATASAGGTYAVYGEGIARIIRNDVGIRASTENTQGPAQNLVLVQKGSIAIGMTTLGPAWDAWNGDLDINPGVRHRDIRALFPMYESPYQIVALAGKNGNGIGSVQELDGKVVGIGPATATGAKYFPNWFRNAGVRVTTRTGQYMNLASDLLAGRLDAVTFAGGAPNPSIVELENTHPINIFTFSDAERAKLLEMNPFLSPYTVVGGTYRSLQIPQTTVAMWNFAIANKALPEDLAFAIVRSVMESNAVLRKIHESAAETKPQNIVHDRFLWLHPGAIRYYRSIGLKVPTALIPPEADGR
jgi:uncharacterized protein